jgi:hypothetical protein
MTGAFDGALYPFLDGSTYDREEDAEIVEEEDELEGSW